MKWDGKTNILYIYTVMSLYVTTINYAFNYSNSHLFCIYVANFIKIHLTVSEISVFENLYTPIMVDDNNVKYIQFLKLGT